MFWQHYLENKKPTFLACIPNKFMLPLWNHQKITVFFRAAKSTLTESSKFPWHDFCNLQDCNRKKEAKTSKDRRHLLKLSTSCEENVSNDNNNKD